MKTVSIRLEGDAAAVDAARTAIAAVLEVEVRTTRPRRDRATGEQFVHQYLHTVVDETRQP